MDNNEAWNLFLKSSGKSLNGSIKVSNTPVFDSGDKPEQDTITADPTVTPKYDIDAILADIHEKALARSDDITEPIVPSPEPEAPPGTAAANPPEEANSFMESAEQDSPDDAPEDMRQLLLEMRGTVRELQTEVKHLRKHVEKRSGEISAAPVGMPQGDSLSVEPGKPHVKKTNKAITIISNVLFYVVIVAIIFGAFLIRSSNGGRPAIFAGYSAFTVLTSSMEDVYPKGSLVITKTVASNELQIGDDITFMINENTSVTHRIVGIDEDFQGSGTRAFTTKGTTNKNNDKDPVAAANVVGKVIFHSKALGDAAGFVGNNWPYLLFVMVVVIILYAILKRTFKDEDAKDEAEEEPKRSRRI